MASVVTICNIALSRVGDNASVSSIDPPDGSAQAEACARFYPVALSSCLDMHNWSFATKRAELSELADGLVEKGPWKHAFALPADCKRVIDIMDTECPKIRTHKHDFEVVGADFGSVILTNVPTPIVRYVMSDPKPSQFSGLFTDALAWLLASYLAGEIIRGDSAFSYLQNCQKVFQQTIALAVKKDANLTHVKHRFVAPWILRR